MLVFSWSVEVEYAMNRYVAVHCQNALTGKCALLRQ